MSAPHPLLGCSCLLCHTWKRIGLLLARPGHPPAFADYALRRCREFYSELLDIVEHPVVGETPVAAGGSPGINSGGGGQAQPKVPPETPPPGVGVLGPEETAVPSQDLGVASTGPVGPNQATAKAPPPACPPAPREEGEDSVPEPETVKEPKEKKKKDKKKKSKKDKDSHHRGRDLPATFSGHLTCKTENFSPTEESEQNSREEGEPRKGRARPVPVSREEEARQIEKRRTPRKNSDSRERGRRSARSNKSARSRSRRNQDSRRREERSRSPHRTRRHSHERYDSRVEGGHRRPAEPVGAPPEQVGAYSSRPPGRFHYNNYYWGAQWKGSKGVKRRERQADIWKDGTDPERKAERERWAHFG